MTPTTSVRRLISPLTRSIGLFECSLVRCAALAAHAGAYHRFMLGLKWVAIVPGALITLLTL